MVFSFLGSNNLSGEIPEDLSKLKDIEYMYVLYVYIYIYLTRYEEVWGVIS